MVESFTLCPWYYILYQYIFEHFPSERRNIIAIGKDFRIDLTDSIEALLAKEYTEEAKTSEELAQVAKARIKAHMSDLNIKESAVFNLLEADCLARLCPNIENASEEVCNNYLSAIDAYDALTQNKQPYIEKIRSRIEAIWAKEDGDIFDNYILQLDILDPNEVEKGIAFVKEKGRTQDAEKYVTALESYNIENIKKTRLYRSCAQHTATGFLLRNLGWIILAFGVTMALVIEDTSFWLQGFPTVAGGALQYALSRLKRRWNIATVNNQVVHSIFTISNAEFAQKANEKAATKS